jgi:hypothetical protein
MAPHSLGLTVPSNVLNDVALVNSARRGAVGMISFAMDGDWVTN